MLRFYPKLKSWPITVSWNAGPLIRSFLNPNQVVTECAVTIAVAADSKVEDAAPADMLEAGATINQDPIEIDGKVCPAGTVVTVALKKDEGVIGAKYVLTFSPTYSVIGEGEGEQASIEVVDELPPPSRR